ncbi:helix-turn-helix transcriptional regulator [Streptomyces chartreusis]|uniref:helix-turn-helix transcriptional regulator n=1 Tax=Streptomyces chartreusis TaxID=1969 RepID=UPI0036A10157
MSVFGISRAEEEVYRHFLRNPGSLADGIHILLNVGPETAQKSLARLHQLGLVRCSGRLVFPTDPEIALSRLVDMRLHDLHQELWQVTHSRHMIAGLLAEQGARAASSQGIEQLEHIDHIRSRIADLAFFAREEILCVEPYTELQPGHIEHVRALDLRCLQRGVRIRNVVLRKALFHGPACGYLRELMSHGATIRVADNISERILIYDRRVALVPVDPENASRGALLASERGLVANLVALFEKIWEQAEDLEGADESSDGNSASGLSEAEQRVLSLMCSVSKDEAGARELGVSVRTYRRYVADLMRVLGAASRVQAALHARERGWI